MREKKGRERRVSTRRELESKIEFFVNADIIAAKSINISETGLNFDTGEPLKIHLRMDIDGELRDREAQFIWATRNSNGGISYGFEFISDPKEHLFQGSIMAKQEILLESGTNEMELLTFLLGDQPFGLNVVKVQAIVQFDPSSVSKIPEAPAALLGMMLYRDRTLPLIDLSAALNMQTTTESERQIVIVTEFNNVVSGFKVDGVKRISRLSWDVFIPVGDFIGSSSESIIGSVNLDEKEVLVIDLEHILAEIIPGMAIEEATDKVLGMENRQLRGNMRIMFAEDSTTIRNSLVRILRDSGFSNVKAFSNGKDAYDALSAIKGKAASKGPRPDDLPHVIVSDIEMPKMDGLTFCKKIKGDTGLKEIPFIIFSSLINEQMVLKCKSVGADSYITKPETNKLVSILDEICLQSGM